MSRILVVDDEARIRQIIRKYAEFEGFEVEEAVDGMQAIEICRIPSTASSTSKPSNSAYFLIICLILASSSTTSILLIFVRPFY